MSAATADLGHDRDLVAVMSEVSKAFGGVTVLDHVDLELRAGEVHALAGENGAGKSTLMRILAGIVAPDAGRIEVDGHPLPTGLRAARDAGVAIVHQELMLAENLTVAENLALGQEHRTRFGWLDRRGARTSAEELLARVGASFSPNAKVGALSTGHQQLVEIARALTHAPKVLILDEPTASLSAAETTNLFRVVAELRSAGTAIVYITHRMDEITELADMVTVLRDGRLIETLAVHQTDPAGIVARMVGRPIEALFGDRPSRQGDVLLDVRGVTDGRGIGPVDLQVRSGEVLGVGGLVGSGRSELARLIFGADTRSAGTVTVAGTAVVPGSPKAATSAGLALVPEDRKRQGLIVDQTVASNMVLASLGQVARHGVVRPGVVDDHCAAECEQLNIKTGRPRTTTIRQLSGGNQQKVLLAKWLRTRPKALILDEPTRGVDIGAKAEIYRIIEQCADDGVAVVVISSELPELLGLADRVVVMREGHLVADLPADGLTEETVMEHAFGLTRGQVLPGHHQEEGESRG